MYRILVLWAHGRRRSLSKSTKLSCALIIVALVVLVGFFVFTGNDDENGASAPESAPSQELLVREDSPILSEGTEATFVEFLDFECEACIALYPTIEQLREKYGDRVRFVVRHMPLHGNSVSAAQAAEAAAEQGQFEAMEQRLFESPEEWGHQETSQEETFFGYAEELGLDMERFTVDFEAPEIIERVEQSQQDGQDLGVQGTPTFFLDGERLAPETTADLENSLNAALDE